MPSSDLICIAEIVGSHGVKGALKMRVYLENQADLETYLPLLKEDGASFPFTILQSGPKGLFIQAPDIQDRTQADALKGLKLFILRERLKALPEDEYYYRDFIGCSVKDQTGKTWGHIEKVSNYGAGDILEVRLDDINDLVLIPFRKEFVPEVHLEKPGYVVVDEAFLESEITQNASAGPATSAAAASSGS